MRRFMNDPENTGETPLESQFGLAGIVMAITELSWSTHPKIHWQNQSNKIESIK